MRAAVFGLNTGSRCEGAAHLFEICAGNSGVIDFQIGGKHRKHGENEHCNSAHDLKMTQNAAGIKASVIYWQLPGNPRKTNTILMIRKSYRWFLAMLLTAAPVVAHHSLAANYDEKKTVTVKGVVIGYDWTNPHVFVYVNVADATGQAASWAVEFASRIEMKQSGWTKDSVKVGDGITVTANPARDGSRKAWGKSVVLAAGTKLSTPATEGDTAPRTASGSKPSPRWPDGHVRLGNAPGETGYWAYPSAHSLAESTNAAGIRMNHEGLLANIADAPKVAPFLPWAKALYEYRQRALLKDDPMASCLPPGGPRQFHTPYGLRILEQPERQRIFIMSGGGNRNWRLIYTDGRNPQKDDLTPTYYGDSTGHWEGDTLVTSVGAFNERFWFSNGGLPHTENLHLTERISRPDYNTLKYEVTVDDPGAYTRPWTSSWTLQRVANQEIDEYFCQENNKDGEVSEQ